MAYHRPRAEASHQAYGHLHQQQPTSDGVSPISQDEYQPVPSFNLSNQSTVAPEIQDPEAPFNPKPEDVYVPHSPLQRRQHEIVAWGLEFGALFLSICSLIAAALVLANYNGKRLDEWHFVTSINTVISALGVLSKATLAFTISSCIGQHKWNWFRVRKDELSVLDKFDSASRGPWGSVDLLFWSKGM